MLLYIILLFPRPIYVVVGIEKNETYDKSKYESSLNTYSSINYEFFETNETYYPINLLRNRAINSIKTTHFFVCDMDFMPSCIPFFNY